MRAIDAIKWIGVIPMSIERPCTFPSNGELRRWFDQKAVRVNGGFPKATDDVAFPIESLVFFPNSKRRTTVL